MLLPPETHRMHHFCGQSPQWCAFCYQLHQTFLGPTLLSPCLEQGIWPEGSGWGLVEHYPSWRRKKWSKWVYFGLSIFWTIWNGYLGISTLKMGKLCVSFFFFRMGSERNSKFKHFTKKKLTTSLLRRRQLSQYRHGFLALCWPKTASLPPQSCQLLPLW